MIRIRQQGGPDPFTLIIEEMLSPLADATLHPGCFFVALRLVVILNAPTGT